MSFPFEPVKLIVSCKKKKIGGLVHKVEIGMHVTHLEKARIKTILTHVSGSFVHAHHSNLLDIERLTIKLIGIEESSSYQVQSTNWQIPLLIIMKFALFALFFAVMAVFAVICI